MALAVAFRGLSPSRLPMLASICKWLFAEKLIVPRCGKTGHRRYAAHKLAA
jgi:hypothetical protein